MSDFITYEDRLKELIEINISLINNKEWNKVYQIISTSDSFLVGKFTELLWNCDIHPEYDVEILPDEFLGWSENITDWTVPSNIKQLGKYCFHSSNIQHVRLHDDIHRMGIGCFYQSEIVDIKLPEALDALPTSTFEDCQELRRVILPKNLQTIGGNVFRRCYHLEYVSELPETLHHIGKACFEECWELRKLEYEGNTREYNFNLSDIRQGSVLERIECKDGDIEL